MLPLIIHKPVLNERKHQKDGHTEMNPPKLACCNFIPEVNLLRGFSLDYGFSGVDWNFALEDRLQLLRELPWCHWWVLELKQEEPLLETLTIVNGFLQRDNRDISD